MSARHKFHTWDNWQAVGKMTDREIGEELHAISKRVGREAVVAHDERYRLQCLCREAGDRLLRRQP